MREIYKEVLHEIMTGEEIDRIIMFAKGKEKRKLKAIKKIYNEIVTINDYKQIPVWLTMMQIDSALLLQEILAMILVKSDKTQVIDKEDYND